MSDSRQNLKNLDPRVNVALQEFLERTDRGETVDREQFLAKHAEIADELRSFIADSEDLRRRAAANSTPSAEVSTNKSVNETIAPTSSGAAPALPAVFGRYRVQRLLGRGAMGAVYLAHDTQLSRQVALKVPGFNDSQSEELLQRFYREARTAATLRHPHICPVHDVGEIDRQHYISMAYIEGQSLSEIIKSQGPQPERKVLLLIRKLALALQEAHDHGVIHRDLKPGNVMVDARGEPVVMDFGLACQVQEGAARLTHSGVIIGSPAYMSPEQVEGDSTKITPAADQYALGVIVYELLTGELPFRGSISAVIGQIVTKPAPSPRLLRTDLDPRVEELCLQMLSKAPGERFGSMKVVADRILAILKKAPTVDGAAAAPPATSPAQAAKADTAAGSEQAAETVPPTGARLQEQVAALVKRGELQAALDMLEPLATRKSGKLADWARQQQVQIREQLAGASKLCRVAAKLIRIHDYAEAVRVLSSVPADSRTEELNDLLSDAEGKEEESRLLLQDIDQAIQNDRPKELPRLVKRFLQLKPANKAVLKLAAELKQYGAERVIQRHRGRSNYFDPAGQVWDPLHIAYYVGGLALVCAAVYLSTIIFQTKNGTVIVEVHDPRVAVKFAGEEITATSSGKTFRLKTTEKKTLQVEIDGVTVDSSTQEITVEQDETKLITARLVDGQVDLQINSEKKSFTVPPKDGASSDEVARQESTQSSFVAPIAGEWIDQLPAIDTVAATGVSKGRLWKRENDMLVGTLAEGTDSAWIPVSLPQKITGDFDLEFDFLLVGTRTVLIDIPLKHTAVSLTITDAGSAIHWIDGKWSNPSNTKLPHGNTAAQTKPGVVHHVTISVRHDGDNVTVDTKFDGLVSGLFKGLHSRVVPPEGAVWFPNYIRLATQFENNTSGHRFEIRKARVRVVTPPSPASAAPADAVVYKGHSYKFFSERLSWTEGKRRCEELGGHLPIVEDRAENDFLVSLCQGKFPASEIGNVGIWLGASDAAKEGDWRLLDGTPLKFTQWHGNQPNNGGGRGEHYAMMLPTGLPNGSAKPGQWSDQPDVANHVAYLVCEWDSTTSSSAAIGRKEMPTVASAGPAAVVLDVDFRKTNGGFSQHDSEHFLTEHKNGEFRYLGKKNGWWFDGLHPVFWEKQNNQLRDFAIEVDVRLVGQKKGRFAIEFGRSGDASLFLCLDQNGQVRLWRAGEENDLVPPTPSSAMRPVDQFNTLRLAVENKVIRASVNGSLVFEKPWERYVGATVCLWLVPNEVPFDTRIQRIRLERLGNVATPEYSKEVRRLKGHTDIVRGMAFLPDNKRAVSVGHGQAFKLWDVTTGQVLHDFAGHTAHVTSVAVSGDGRRALTGCWDAQVRLWDLDNRTLLKTLKGHADRIGSVLLSRDGNTGLSVSNDGTIYQWDLKTSAKPKLLPGPAVGAVLAMSHAENVVASGNQDGTVVLRNAKGIGTLTGHIPGYVEGLAFTPDGTKLVTGADDGTVRIWDLQTGKEIHRFETDGVGFDTVAITKDGRYVIAGCGDHTILGWDLQTGDRVARFHADAPVTHRLALSPDNQYVLSGGGDQAWKPVGDYDIRLWKLPSPPAPP